ncbi:hypothetical protein V5097_10555 [Arenibacter palladensis]|uniref:hypothetical protein n=1 Tax=Arenibacter palladensis TaxID=237373 RepID=UPI002FCF1EED
MFLITVGPAILQSQHNVMDGLADNLQSLSINNRTSIYLQTNKGIFEAGEDLWFKAYSLDARFLEPSVVDSTLYVQLINRVTDSIVWQEKYEMVNGFSDGHILLDGSLDEGAYLLKAYTKNSFPSNPKEFYSVRKVRIVGNINDEIEDIGIKKPSKDSIGNIQFDLFPEGGYLIDGIKSKVAFKAVEEKGIPVKVSGTLYENDSPILEFTSTHAGMGSFHLVPDASKKYDIGLDLPNGPGPIHHYLPGIKDNGITLRLNKRDNESIVFKISGNIGRQRVYLRTQVRGVVLMMATGILEDTLGITMPIRDFPQGICEVTLFDESLSPVAERLFYVNPGKKLNISAELSKKTYKTREKVILKIKTTDVDGNPVEAHLGASVYDRVYKNQDDGKDILTHYHLTTQLKGTIYDPGYYFDEGNKNRDEALDLLMLTQGWRRYIWNEKVQKEQNTSIVLTEGIHGNVTTIKKKKGAPEQQTVMVLDPSNKIDSHLVFLDSSKSFYLGPKDLKMGRRFYVKHFGTKDHKIILNARDGFNDLGRINNGHQINYPLANIKKEIKKPISPFKIQGGIDLDEVSVKGKKSKVFRDRYIGKLDSLAKLRINMDYVCISGTLNCEVHEFDSKNRRPVEGEHYISYMGFQWNADRTAYTIEGRRSIEYHYPEFTEAEILEKFNLLKVIGYFGKKEFYQPNYEENDDPFPDYRNSLLWRPEVITDNKGEATIEFYCSDINTYFEGIIEGVGLKGLLGKNEFSFFVSKGEGKN